MSLPSTDSIVAAETTHTNAPTRGYRWWTEEVEVRDVSGIRFLGLSCSTVFPISALAPSAGSIEAPNMLLALLALVGNLCNLIATVSYLTK